MRIALVTISIILLTGCTPSITPEQIAAIDHNFNYIVAQEKKLIERLDKLENHAGPTKTPNAK